MVPNLLRSKVNSVPTKNRKDFRTSLSELSEVTFTEDLI